jgi:osmotically-inducible protein OsmY
MMSLRPLASPAVPILAAALLVAGAGLSVTGCAPIVVAAGIGAGALVAVDRRSTGAQVDDEAIEFKVTTAAGSRWDTRVHLNVTSYNGNVLLTGEAPTPTVRDEIEQLAKTTDRVRGVTNDIVIGPDAGLGARTHDSYITSKVKARFVEARRFDANRVKVVTERSVVYLLGIVTRGEADAAAQVAASTSDVVRVVKVFEYIN